MLISLTLWLHPFHTYEYFYTCLQFYIYVFNSTVIQLFCLVLCYGYLKIFTSYKRPQPSGGSRNFFQGVPNKHKLHNLIKRKFCILTTIRIKKTRKYIKFTIAFYMVFL